MLEQSRAAAGNIPPLAPTPAACVSRLLCAGIRYFAFIPCSATNTEVMEMDEEKLIYLVQMYDCLYNIVSSFGGKDSARENYDMLPTSVYVTPNKRSSTSPLRPASTPPSSPNAGSNVSAIRTKRVEARMVNLRSSDWNGHIEVTDECRMGLALFEIKTKDFIPLVVDMRLKNDLVQRRMKIHPVGNTWTHATVNLFRTDSDVAVPDSMMSRLSRVGTEKYISEYILITQLLRKMIQSDGARDRWIPSFSPPLKGINELLNRKLPHAMGTVAFTITGLGILRPATLGHWFLSLLTERVRRGVSDGIGLRTMLYCVSWMTRLLSDNDIVRMELSAPIIRAWLLGSACGDCVYASLKELRSEYAFEYVFNVADSFSTQIRLPDIRPVIRSLPCGDVSSMSAVNEGGFLRTFGVHSVLTSPYANTSLKVKIETYPGEGFREVFMTGRQVTTLLLVLDLHARVLRATDWRQGLSVLKAWMMERRANNGEAKRFVLTKMIEDLVRIRAISVSMCTAVAHLAPLIFKGKLSGEMLSAYRDASVKQNKISSHIFIVRHCFLRASSPELQTYSDCLFENFARGDEKTRRSMLTLDHCDEAADMQYEITPTDIDLAAEWNIELPEVDDDVEELLANPLVFSNSSEVDVNDDEHDSVSDDLNAKGEDDALDSARALSPAEESALMACLQEDDEMGDSPKVFEPSDSLTYRDAAEIFDASMSSPSTQIDPSDSDSVGYNSPRGSIESVFQSC